MLSYDVVVRSEKDFNILFRVANVKWHYYAKRRWLRYFNIFSLSNVDDALCFVTIIYISSN